MRIPSWVVAASVPGVPPFGWGLGVVAAHLMAGHDFGQLLALTVPLCSRRSCIRIRSVAVAHPGEAARDLEHRNGTVVSTYLSSQTVDKS
jgi:hypothetical protein